MPGPSLSGPRAAVCAYCGLPNPASALRCRGCGSDLPVTAVGVGAASEPGEESAAAGRPHYLYREDYGETDASYIAADNALDETSTQPRAARLKADVYVVRTSSSWFRRSRTTWIAPAGSIGQLLGYWSDGTRHLRLTMMDTADANRRTGFDGRFPDWVAETTSGAVPDPVPLASDAPPFDMRWVGVGLVVLLFVVAGYALLRGEDPPTLDASATPSTAQKAVQPGSNPSPNASPGSAPAAAAGATSPAAVDKAAGIVIVANTDGEGVFIRGTPAMADRVRAYAEGTELRIVGADVEAEGRRWRQVQAPDGLQGYVPSEYVQP